MTCAIVLFRASQIPVSEARIGRGSAGRRAWSCGSRTPQPHAASLENFIVITVKVLRTIFLELVLQGISPALELPEIQGPAACVSDILDWYI